MGVLMVFYRISVDTRQDEFEEAYRSYKPHMEQVPGHLDEMLIRSLDDPSAYVIVSQWQPEAFAAWLQSPAHQEIVKILNTYKSSAAQVSRYILLQHFE
jgi:heme-degrading monooxygenase HmoA